MITLRTDTGLLDIDSWQEIRDRIQFREKLNPADHELETIFGRYAEKDWLRCGLTTCNHEHMKGYLVKTKLGLETNIGKDCGKTHFGVDFEELSRTFEQDLTASRNREILWATWFRLEEIESTIGSIRSSEHGADWIQSLLKRLQTPNSGCPEVVVKAIGRMVKNGDSRILVERKATPDELRSFEASQLGSAAAPKFIEETKGNLKGVGAFRPENDLRRLLIIEVAERLKQFKSCDIDSLSNSELKDWARWSGRIDINIELSRLAVDEGRSLLTKSNLGQFFEIIDRKDDKLLFQSFVRSLPD
jgi:hypothetical protein